MTTPPPGEESWRVYTAKPRLSSDPAIYFIGAVLLLLIGIGGFLLTLRAPRGMVQLQFTSTIPTMFAFGLAMTGYHLARAPRQVVFGLQGLAVRSRRSETIFNWDQIAWGESQTQPFTGRKLFIVYGNDGKALVKVPSTLERFDGLVAAITQRLTDHPSPHASAMRWRKSRNQAKLLAVFAVLALPASIGMAWAAYGEHRDQELMRTSGVEAEGVVVRKFIAPNGRTHRIEFRVADAGDAAKLHNVEIERELWGELQTGERLPIKTVPGHPEVARLLSGGVENDVSDPSPAMSALAAVIFFVMAALFAVAAVLGFKGINIKTDPVSRKLTIERLPKLAGGPP